MVKNTKCFLNIHTLILVRSLSASTDLVECVHCKKKQAVNYDVRIALKWDRQIEKFYEEMDRLTK